MFRNPLGDVRIMGNIAAQQEAANIYETPPYTSGSWSPTLGGFATNPTNSVYLYITIGKLCIATVYQAGAGSSNSSVFTITAPFTAATISNAHWQAEITYYTNGGVQSSTPGLVEITSGQALFNLYRDNVGGGWSNGSTKAAGFTIMYKMV